MNGTLVRGGDRERFWFVCVLPLQAAHKVFAGKRGEFFFKRRWKQSDCCFSVRFSFSLSLSLCFLSYKRSSLRWREEESSREILLLLLLLLLKLVLSLLCWGSFITKDDTTHAFSFAEWACVFWSFCSSPRVFSFLVVTFFWLWPVLCFLLWTRTSFYLQKKTLFPSIQCVGNTLKFLS